METSGGVPQKRVWHLSRGFVFANDNRVAYPRLSLARYHSAPALATHGSSSEPPLGGLLRETTSETELGDGAGDGMRVPVIDSSEPTEQDGIAVEPQERAVEGAAEGASTAEVAKPKEEAPPSKPPFTPLDFKIPDNVFQDAKKALEGDPKSFWSYSLYQGSNEAGPQKIKVHYCRSKHTTERVLQQYFMNEKILGLDLEWAGDAKKTHSARRNVSLVQLASSSRIALFHLAMYPKDDELVAPSLKQILEDPEVTKVGVWIKGDCTRLRNYLGIEARSIFELSHLYRLVKYSSTGELDLINKKYVNMAKQVEDVLQLPLFKGLDVRASDWSRALSMEQITCMPTSHHLIALQPLTWTDSASDAYAAVQLYHVLDNQRQSLDPTPPLPYHADLNLPIRLADKVVLPEETEDTEEEPEAKDEPAVDATAITIYLNSTEMKSSVSVEEEDSEQLAVSKENVTESITTTDTTTTVTTAVASITTTTTKKPKKDPPPPKDPRVTEAEVWAKQRCASGKAPAYMLRAYYLWYNHDDLGPEGVAALLREPPLATLTVVQYITEAIRLGTLVYDKRRLRDEVLAKLPAAELKQWRFRGLAMACQELDEEV
jgi:exonuclease 3'-5' domain-containing protein 2